MNAKGKYWWFFSFSFLLLLLSLEESKHTKFDFSSLHSPLFFKYYSAKDKQQHQTQHINYHTARIEINIIFFFLNTFKCVHDWWKKEEKKHTHQKIPYEWIIINRGRVVTRKINTWNMHFINSYLQVDWLHWLWMNVPWLGMAWHTYNTFLFMFRISVNKHRMIVWYRFKFDNFFLFLFNIRFIILIYLQVFILIGQIFFFILYFNSSLRNCILCLIKIQCTMEYFILLFILSCLWNYILFLEMFWGFWWW